MGEAMTAIYDKIKGHAVTQAQSDEESAQPQTLRDAAENLLIAIGMGWDLNGCAENLRAALAQSDAEPVAWRPDADMRAELDRSELVARALLKEIMKQIDYIESEGHIEWHKRITVHGELYLPDLSAAALAALYAAPPRPDASAGLIEAAELAEQWDRTLEPYRDAKVARETAMEIAKALRARAADRSWK
jgi:hypothetical protein